ncbi:STAS-like domain-containing protein [Stenotrophomonas maltophilia]|uniref:STAS-like domain-containing protein n=1 Tax=Stenotrophomonas maltophilia TaxID=40324 RepID=UPI000DF817AD|nr:STAS-like domain-containing protein [Stenotrophomonas maltophilia]MCF3487353.1 DUF4325 domain-containing protein [Stenotrophomonas maltophilia]MCU1157523.1 STAS-like domain-containing protein [Stenotrophomonas maltophilia]HDS1666811.1 STAS-like domain-containing protein [Stenotrophomonas maltophilia]
MNTFYSVPGESDLASRTSAARLRSSFEEKLSASTVCLDLTDVLSISESYADELFGVLVYQYGLEWVFSRLQVVGASPPVIRTIRTAIRYRLERDIQQKSHRALVGQAEEAVKRHAHAFA